VTLNVRSVPATGPELPFSVDGDVRRRPHERRRTRRLLATINELTMMLDGVLQLLESDSQRLGGGPNLLPLARAARSHNTP